LAPFFCSGAETEFARAQLENPKGNIKTIGIGVGLGIMVGTVIGALTDNIGLWIAIGIAVGAAIGASSLRLLGQQKNES
jgi:uncharacterized membrane protein